MRSQLIQLIQRQVPVGSKVKFVLRNGAEMSGILQELGLDHVTLECDNGSATVLVEMLAAWHVIEEYPMQAKEDGTAFHDSEVLKQLLGLETRFHAQLQVATIHIKPPDFSFPVNELEGTCTTEVWTTWSRIKDKYSYAEKINELGAKFGRVQLLIGELKALAKRFPNSVGIKRHLAYLLWLSGNQRDAINMWKDVASMSDDVWDWYNVAAMATTDGSKALAYHGLQLYFEKKLPTDSLQAWYVYIKLVQELSAYSTFIILWKRKNAGLTEDVRKLLLETCIYLLKVNGEETLSAELVRAWLTGQLPVDQAFEALEYLNKKTNELNQLPDERQQDLSAAFKGSSDNSLDEESNFSGGKDFPRQPKGYIYTFKRDRNFGFLQGVDGVKYFFHRSAIVDDELLDKLQRFMPNERIPVVYETAQGPKGPLAIGISLYRSLEEMFARATEYADEGEYNKAIAVMKKVLEFSPDYPKAKDLYERWREYAREVGVPKGSNPYAQAKRAQLIDRDPDKAIRLFRVAVQQGDHTESAIKDLAGLLVQVGRPEEAIQVLIEHRGKIRDRQSVDNMLIGFYQNAGQYDHAIDLLSKKLNQAQNEGEKIQVLWQIASCYLRKEDYVQAEHTLRTIEKLQPHNKTVQRHIAVCLFQRGLYEDAEILLNDILSKSSDTKAVELLELIKQVKAGQLSPSDEIIIETTLSDFSRQISGFAQFFLDRCEFTGVPQDRVQEKKFDYNDIQKLENLAAQLGPRRPRDRAGYYLSAAKIVSLFEGSDSDQFYKYLCRGFASSGDAAVIDSRPLDTAREFYCESLSLYDGVRSRSGFEQDAVKALVRFLFSSMGQAQIPVNPSIPSIDETLETVLSQHPDRNRVFEAITYLVFRSRFAALRLLHRLYHKSSLQAMALEYLKLKGILPVAPVKSLSDFIQLWNERIRRNSDDVRTISNEFHFLGNFQLTTASLEGSIERTRRLVERLFFDLDQQRAIQLQKIFETALELCREVTFEEQERLCLQIGNRCQELLAEIEENPTKLSIEEMYPLVEAIQKKIKTKLEELYESSTPQLVLRLPMESYTPDHNRRIEVQVVVSNRIGCSPAEILGIVVQEHELTMPLKLDGSLRGGDQRILKVPIQVSEHEIQSKAFSLPVYVRYRTRTGDVVATPVNNFSVRLYSEEEFEIIPNPYAAYAEGGIVRDPAMFYGREELIANIAEVLQQISAQGKCILIYGQKRAGKSSILYHIKRKLVSNDDLLILDLDIGSILDEHSATPFLYQFLFVIIQKLGFAIEDKVSEGRSELNISFPTEREFYEHPNPLSIFRTLMDRFRRAVSRSPEWRDVRLILLIDEFSYIYVYIMKELIPESFMKNWKALLQEGFFSVVLVGQDLMPKFKQRFPNEFGTTQDERVTYLKREDAERLIDEPIRIGGSQGESRYRERAIERIIDLTAGSPFYIQIICNRLVEYMNRKRASLVTEADVEQVKEELIRGTNALTLDKFENLLNSGDTSEDAIDHQDALKVLTVIAVNSRTGPCSRHSIVCTTRMPIDHILDDLIKRGVLEQSGQCLSIRVGLFKEWLFAHYGGADYVSTL